MTNTDWQIPPSILHWLSEVPTSTPVAILLRHSVRDFLPPGEAGYSLPITDVGVSLSRQLGRILGQRLLTLHASPLLRCVQTAEALAAGAQVELPIIEDQLLGDPGIFVIDGKQAWKNWNERGHEEVMSHLVSKDFPLQGMAAPDPAAKSLVQHMLAVAGQRAGIHIFVTHDSLVTATAARLLKEPLGVESWPWYLEGAFFWRDHNSLHTRYREFRGCRPALDLVAFNEQHVIDFARREISRTLGNRLNFRFFLAGGAFKNLLTGRPPRDLDLWAPGGPEREALQSTLTANGAKRLAKRPFADKYDINGRIVELPTKVAPATLEERLARFDIALSAVGVEHQSGGKWRAVIHPLALESVKRREVLLLKPLANWKYALTTLERMRRYAEELDYSVPPEEEAEVWRVFDSQPETMKRAMLERFERTSLGGYGVKKEALCRLQ